MVLWDGYIINPAFQERRGDSKKWSHPPKDQLPIQLKARIWDTILPPRISRSCREVPIRKPTLNPLVKSGQIVEDNNGFTVLWTCVQLVEPRVYPSLISQHPLESHQENCKQWQTPNVSCSSRSNLSWAWGTGAISLRLLALVNNSGHVATLLQSLSSLSAWESSNLVIVHYPPFRQFSAHSGTFKQCEQCCQSFCMLPLLGIKR